MFKRIKSIIAAMLAVAMLTSVCCVPAMAVEQKLPDSEVKSDIFEGNGSQIGIGQGLGNYQGNTIEIGTIRIDSAASVLFHNITGPSNQWVNVRLIRQGSGDTRNFTGISGAGWLKDKYLQPLKSGYWDIYIIGAGTQGEYSVYIKAYTG